MPSRSEFGITGCRLRRSCCFRKGFTMTPLMKSLKFTYILIAGGGHGGWCWRDVQPLLEEAGHRVIAPDLPGHGQDQTPLSQVTFRSYVDCVINLVDQAPGPVILCGHSLGGMTVTQVAEERWDKIAQVIYLSAIIPSNGQCAMDIDLQSPLTQHAQFTESEMYQPPQIAAEFFYHDCNEEAVAFALRHLRPEPL